MSQLSVPEPGPVAEGIVEAPRLTVAAVARRLGVAPATLRTWDRRYGLGPSEHPVGSHRRYTAGDVARLVAVRRLTLEGVTPADAAAAVRGGTASVEDEAVGVRRRTGGGRVVAVPDAAPAARGLGRAAMALDSQECHRLVSESIQRHGTIPTWEQLLRPVLVAVGERWSSSGSGIEVEHMLTESILAALRDTSAAAPPPSGSGSVLLAAGKDEEHGLPLHVLAAACAERQVATRMLGVRVPGEALAAAVLRTGPAAVFVFALLPVSDPGLLAGLRRLRPRPLLLLGGPGWATQGGPAGAERVDSLAAAADRLAEAVGV